MRAILALLSVIFAATVPAIADESCHPISAAAINAQWEHYISLPGVQPNGDGDKYECIAIESSKQLVCRTKEANPAHPSIVIRTVEQTTEGISVRTEADTAGDCAAFLSMMAQYRQIDADMREKMRRQTGH